MLLMYIHWCLKNSVTYTLTGCRVVLCLNACSSFIRQSDVGGQRTLQRRWTTFAKAQLLCQADNELPYNVIQDMDTLPPAEGSSDETLFYGIFHSQWSVSCFFCVGSSMKSLFLLYLFVLWPSFHSSKPD